jgi:galactoside O-acetyltransferase
VKVIDGVHVGNGVVLGSGAVANKDIDPFMIAVGVPAKVIKNRKT